MLDAALKLCYFRLTFTGLLYKTLNKSKMQLQEVCTISSIVFLLTLIGHDMVFIWKDYTFTLLAKMYWIPSCMKEPKNRMKQVLRFARPDILATFVQSYQVEMFLLNWPLLNVRFFFFISVFFLLSAFLKKCRVKNLCA